MILFSDIIVWSALYILVTGRWSSPGTPVSSTSKTDHHDIAEILLKVALNTNYTNPLPLN
jgi:hypothetical protein